MSTEQQVREVLYKLLTTPVSKTSEGVPEATTALLSLIDQRESVAKLTELDKVLQIFRNDFQEYRDTNAYRMFWEFLRQRWIEAETLKENE